MSATLLSTREVASMLDVNESTVKRWTNEGLIGCFKTPGGHRKYRASDVAEFARTQGFKPVGISLLAFGPEEDMRIRAAAMERRFDQLAEIYRECALRGESAHLLEFAGHLYTSGISFADICDRVIRPAMVHIGEAWEKGELDINQEHVASYATIDMLTRMQPLLRRAPARGTAVTCGALMSDLHDIPLLCIRNALESGGWRTHFIGGNIPVASLADSIRRYEPGLVCLSATIERKEGEIVEALRELRRLTEGRAYELLLGGGAFTAGVRAQIEHAHFFSGVGELESWLAARYGADGAAGE